MNIYNVDRIKRGRQFKTYISNSENYVIKVPLSGWEIFFRRMIFSGPITKIKLLYNPEMSFGLRDLAINSLLDLQKTSIDSTKLGNPNLVENQEIMTWSGRQVLDRSIIQDKVTVIEEVLNKDNYKTIIDDFIELNHYFWRHKIFEYVFNFTINNGINSKGELVQLDFGEFFIDDLDACIAKCKTKPWFKARSYRYSFLDKIIKTYYTKRANQEFTIDKLKQLWGADL
jgi:hypothetical protein